jgi:formylglycine-generating enzyme required for sulfatase activity
VLLFVTTDAPVGPAGSSPPLFDRLRIAIYPPGSDAPCAGCDREFAVEDDRMALGRASFGLVAPPNTPGYRARLRLFRSAGVPSGEPRVGATIEHVVALPTAPAEGVAQCTAILPVADVASPKGTLADPVATTPGPPPEGIVGTFVRPFELPCKGAPREDEVCIPGGVFWMGSPAVDTLDAFQIDGRDERLVAVSPFFLDVAEVTVAAMRSARVARVLDDPVEHGPNARACLYTEAPGPFDALPVNCLTWQRARAFCEKQGKRLPTEAEWEYAAGARESRPFPWGGDVPACGDAVFGRGTVCAGKSGPEVAGTGARDRAVFAGRSVVDLAGNLRELVADRFESSNVGCWVPGFVANPRCDSETDSPNVPRSVRGGAYADGPSGLQAALRSFLPDERAAVSALIGFRCARDAR